jgi:hypothetical protein
MALGYSSFRDAQFSISPEGKQEKDGVTCISALLRFSFFLNKEANAIHPTTHQCNLYDSHHRQTAAAAGLAPLF